VATVATAPEKPSQALMNLCDCSVAALAQKGGYQVATRWLPQRRRWLPVATRERESGYHYSSVSISGERSY
jgi:hypothetical protein